ncbi:MAG TPA: heavy metal translocating P-type ATPase metal-binding domain-containing protein, partial [Verrucomicrobiae bacterium]|nr:heavy metal translocating P-type ATPase metal-binding domain-containing protein [Verrucomicrobiae bacterium]
MQEIDATMDACGESAEFDAALRLDGRDVSRPGDASGRTLESGCFHCGTPLRGAVFTSQQKEFCCRGCLTVFELLSENG